MRKIFICLAILLLPSGVSAPLLRLMGYRIGKGVRFGFSAVLVDKLAVGDNVRIGHLNLVRIRRLLLAPGAVIGRQNVLNGPLSACFERSASIGNRNRILRAPSPHVVNWGARLHLDEGARITSDHMVDCTRDVYIGQHSILAGSGSQLWTHAYIHAQEGPGRYRMDGKIRIGNNAYIGSRCIVNLGISIAPGCTVGAGAVVSKHLTEPGLYVGSALRMLPVPADPAERADLTRSTSPALCEAVFHKRLERDARQES